MSVKNMSFETKSIHAGEPRARYAGSVNIPIFQSSTYEIDKDSQEIGMRYLRLNNTPNHIFLHRKLAALECSEAALVTSSGMSAITTTLNTFLELGDHCMVVPQGMYPKNYQKAE